MPDFAGWPISSANAALAKVGIRTGAPNFVDVPVAAMGSGNAPLHPQAKPGSVLAQLPAAGSRIDQSTVVHFTVVK
jgi:beta-lactam-binding protein with PASTA domain